MGYVDQTLGANERILCRAWFPIAHWIGIWAALLLPSVPFLAAWATVPVGQWHWLIWVCGLAAPFGMWLFATRGWTMLSTEIAVTSNRIVVKRGIFSRQTDEIAIPNIETVQMHQGLSGVVLGIAAFTIEGTGDDRVHIPPIAWPFLFRRAIEDARGQRQPAPAQTNGATPQ
jgi:uncharacterized membrane protein YdbT with pleckstrin-like domain